MRGRKRLRKKLRAKEKKIAKIAVSLELGENIPQGASKVIVQQFRSECLGPEGLIFDAKSNALGWNGKITSTNRSMLNEDHRKMIADWAFMQEEIESYSVSQLSPK